MLLKAGCSVCGNSFSPSPNWNFRERLGDSFFAAAHSVLLVEPACYPFLLNLLLSNLTQLLVLFGAIEFESPMSM